MGLKKLNLNSKFEIFLGIIKKKYIYIYICICICIRIYKNSNMFTKNKIYTTTIF